MGHLLRLARHGLLFDRNRCDGDTSKGPVDQRIDWRGQSLAVKCPEDRHPSRPRDILFSNGSRSAPMTVTANPVEDHRQSPHYVW